MKKMEHQHITQIPHFNKYAKPTVELVLTLLAEAYKDEGKLDKLLAKLSEEVIQDLKEALEDLIKRGKLDLDAKINLANHPDLYRALKEIEREKLNKLTEYYWIGAQVIGESMTRSYKETMLQTYVIYNRPVPDLTTKVQIRDTYITEKVLPIPWCQDGKLYSERLYGHVANFKDKLAFVLEEGIQKGKGLEWMEKAWRKLTGATAYDIARLLKTETMAMWSVATKSTLLEIGVEYVEIVGDAECGGICLDYVGEAIPLREAEIGDLLPPYHPNCACSFVEYTEIIEVPVDEIEEIEE